MTADFPSLRTRLSELSPDERAAALEIIEKKRRSTHRIFYWQPFKGMKGLPGQVEALRKWKAEHKVFGILGGNRAGKTELVSAVMTAAALGKETFRHEPAWKWVKDLPLPEPPLNIWIVALDSKVGRAVNWREKLTGPEGLLPEKGIRKIRDHEMEIEFDNGTYVTMKTAESGASKFQGASVDLAWIDEECEKDIYDETYQRTIDCEGKILLSLTPLKSMDSGVRDPWVYDLYQQFLAGQKDLCFVHIPLDANPYVPEAEKKKTHLKWANTPEEAARLDGRFITRSGLVYPMFNEALHMEDPFRVSREWRRIVMIDGASSGPTAATWTAVEPITNNLHVYRTYKESNKVVSQHAKAILDRTYGELIDDWFLDPAWGSQRNPETLRQNAQLYRDAGIPVRLPEMDPDWGLSASLEYMNATKAVKTRTAMPKLFIFNTCADLRDEIKSYVYDTWARGPLRGKSKEKPRKGNDHLINCMQYTCALKPKGRRARNERPSRRSAQERARLNSYT